MKISASVAQSVPPVRLQSQRPPSCVAGALLTIQVRAPPGAQGPGLRHSPPPTVLPLPFQGGHAACSPQPQGPACLFLWRRQGRGRQVWGETCFQHSPASPDMGLSSTPTPWRQRALNEQPKVWVHSLPPPARRAHPWLSACFPYCHHLPGSWPPHPQDCAPAGREEPWVSSGFGHGAREAEESSPQAPAGLDRKSTRLNSSH